MQSFPIPFNYSCLDPNIPTAPYLQTPSSYILIEHFPHPNKTTGKITVLNNLIIIINNTHLPNNNLLHKHFSSLGPDDCHTQSISLRMKLISMSSIYKTTKYNDGSPQQNSTYLITASLVLTLRLAVNITGGQNTCCVLDSCRTSVNGNR